MNRKKTPTEATPAMIVSLLAIESSNQLPAQTWPVQAALESLHARTSPASPLGRALGRWPTEPSVAGSRFRDIGGVLRQLMAMGFMEPQGEGSSAHYILHDDRQSDLKQFRASLSPEDRAALWAASQRLVDRWRRLSNMADTGVSRTGSATTTS